MVSKMTKITEGEKVNGRYQGLGPVGWEVAGRIFMSRQSNNER